MDVLGLSPELTLAFAFTHTKVLGLAHAINEVLQGKIPKDDKAMKDLKRPHEGAEITTNDKPLTRY